MQALRELLAKFNVDVDGKSKLVDTLKVLGLNEEKSKALAKGFEALKVAMPIGALGVGVKLFRNWVQGSVEAADATGELAEQIGYSAAGAQRWITFIRLAGGRQTDLQKINQKLSESIAGATESAGKQRDMFEALGVQYADEAGNARDLEDVLLDVSAAIGAEENGTKRLALAKEVLGKAGVKLASSLKSTREEMLAALGAAGDLGGTFSDEFVAQAQKANDEIDFMHGQFAALKSELVIQVLPVFRWMTRLMIDLTRGVRTFLKESGVLDRWAKASPFFASGGILALIVKNWGLLSQWVSRVFALLRPFIPIILRFLAWALILDDLITYLQGGDSALGAFLDTLLGVGGGQKVLDLLKNSFDLIKLGVEQLIEDVGALWSRITDLGSIAEWFRGAWEAALTWISDFIEAGPVAKIEMLLGLLEAAWAKIQEIAAGLSDNFVTRGLKGLADLQMGDEDARLNAEAVARAGAAATAPTAKAGGRGGVTVNDSSSVSVTLNGKQTPETVRAAGAEAAKLRGKGVGRGNALVRGAT